MSDHPLHRAAGLHPAALCCNNNGSYGEEYRNACFMKEREDKPPPTNIDRFLKTSASLLTTKAVNKEEPCSVIEICTRDLLLHYVMYRLENKGYSLKDHRKPIIRQLFQFVGMLTVSPPAKIVADLGNSLDSDHANRIFFDEPLRFTDISSNDAKKRYFKWLNNLFRDKNITWGRLALTVVYTAKLAEHAMTISNYEEVEHVIDWCCLYFKHCMFDEWISSRGGWIKLPPVIAEKEVSLTKRMPSKAAMACGTLAVAALGTVCFLLTRT